jgi:hypothetical protein
MVTFHNKWACKNVFPTYAYMSFYLIIRLVVAWRKRINTPFFTKGVIWIPILVNVLLHEQDFVDFKRYNGNIM